MSNAECAFVTAGSIRDPSAVYPKVVKSDTTDLGAVRGLNVGIAGSANLTQPDGTERDGYPLQLGYNPIQVRKVRVGGTADDIWALY